MSNDYWVRYWKENVNNLNHRQNIKQLNRTALQYSWVVFPINAIVTQIHSNLSAIYKMIFYFHVSDTWHSVYNYF